MPNAAAVFSAITALVSIPRRLQVLEEVLHNLEQDGTMSVEDFFYSLFRNAKPLTPSASTPYRQLKRHLSMQVRDGHGALVHCWGEIGVPQAAVDLGCYGESCGCMGTEWCRNVLEVGKVVP